MTTLINPSYLLQQTQVFHSKSAYQLNMKRIGVIILSGGQGTRLFPLTMSRCKPAISFGGRHRLIDITISNSIHSGCQKIYIITQFLSTSLHQHILKTYHANGLIEILSNEEKPESKNWFKGTADAVRQNLDYLIDIPADYFFILSGDHIYNMDLQQMLMFAKEKEADMVIASLPVTESNAKRMGIMKIDDREFITDFQEKPQDRFSLDQLRLSNLQKQKMGIGLEEKCDYLGSMGIYLFKREVLFDLLQNDPREDFGKHLIPTKMHQGNVAAYIHHGYWEDVGTIKSFYEANMALTHSDPVFSFYNEEMPIFVSPTHLPGAKICGTRIKNAIICEGSVIDAEEVTHSILGPRTMIHQGAIIQDSYIIGNDFFAPPTSAMRLPRSFQIGENSIIRKAIIDRNVSIGKGVQLINKNKLTHYDGENIYIRDGIIIVSRGAVIPDSFIL